LKGAGTGIASFPENVVSGVTKETSRRMPGTYKLDFSMIKGCGGREKRERLFLQRG